MELMTPRTRERVRRQRLRVKLDTQEEVSGPGEKEMDALRARLEAEDTARWSSDDGGSKENSPTSKRSSVSNSNSPPASPKVLCFFRLSRKGLPHTYRQFYHTIRVAHPDADADALGSQATHRIEYGGSLPVEVPHYTRKPTVSIFNSLSSDCEPQPYLGGF